MMKKRIFISNLTKYIERLGTGTGDMIERCRSAGLAEPEFSVSDGFVTTIYRKPAQAAFTGEVTGEVGRLLAAISGEMKRQEMQEALGLKHEEHFRMAYLVPALTAGLIEMTIPGKPKSRMQKYRLTPKGKALLAAIKAKGGRV